MEHVFCLGGVVVKNCFESNYSKTTYNYRKTYAITFELNLIAVTLYDGESQPVTSYLSSATCIPRATSRHIIILPHTI